MGSLEIWKDIVGYEGIYQVSNRGSIISLNRSRINSKGIMYNYIGQSIKLEVMKLGYLRAQLSNEKGRFKTLVHVLVAHHFVDGYFEGAEVNHEDGNKQNNNDWNLKWTTKSNNVLHSYRVLGRNSDVQKNKKAITVLSGNDIVGNYESIQDAARKMNISASNIFEAATNNRKTKGFTVMFAHYDNESGLTIVSGE